jgi:hypothetical protein
MTYLLPKTTQILISGQVDLTTAGSVLLFTTPGSTDFVITTITWISTDLDTITVDALFNIGTNATAYDNIVAGSPFFLTTTGTSTTYLSFAPSPVLPSLSGVYINILTPMTAVTGTGQFFIEGILTTI